jgi:hypothetical protein
MNIVKFEAVEDIILNIRGIQVILDSYVAELYGVETKRNEQPRRKRRGICNLS